MTSFKHKLAAATAVVAAFSMAATPAAAVELPRVAGQQVAKAGTLDVENRRYRGYRHRDRDRIDAGDVLTGVLILGGIAAIAGAANNRNRERVEQRYPDEPYRGRDDDARYAAPVPEEDYGSIGVGRAVDRCVAEVEASSGPVRSVDAAGREADGWRVSGQLENGSDYWCTLDTAGRIRGVGGSGTAAAEPVEDGQYDDAYYERARASKAQVGADEANEDLGGGSYSVAAAQ